MLLIKTHPRLGLIVPIWLRRSHNHGRRQGGTSHILHGWQQAKRESLSRETPIFKTIRSPETYSLSWEQHWKDLPPRFNYLPLGLSHATLVIMTTSHEIWLYKGELPGTSSPLLSAAMWDMPFTFHHDCEASPATWNCKSNKPLSFVNCPVLSMSLSAAWKWTNTNS